MLDGTNCRATNCCAAALDTFSKTTAHTNEHQNTCTEHRAIDDSESNQNRGAFGWKFLHVNLLAH
jgi:hypothetical protein